MSVFPFIDVMHVVCDHLDAAGICYAVTGSIASSVHGEPVTTNDIDICMHLSLEQGHQLQRQLPRRFYRSDDAMNEAVAEYRMWNLVDMETQTKVDFCVLPPGPFWGSVLARRIRIEYSRDRDAFWTVSPEDIILMKLLWRRDSRSQKQWENALSVARTSGNRLDTRYLREWASKLGLGEDAAQLLSEAAL